MSKQDEYMLIDGIYMTVAAFDAMSKEEIKYITAIGCTALTELHAPKAVHITANGCTALTEIHADNAEYIYAVGCTALTGMIHGGEDRRRYYFFGLQQQGKYRIFAGCRNYTPEQALAHWGPGGPSDRPDCLALVQKIIAEIKTKEQA